MKEMVKKSVIKWKQRFAVKSSQTIVISRVKYRRIQVSNELGFFQIQTNKQVGLAAGTKYQPLHINN